MRIMRPQKCINGIPHLAYLGRMLEKREGFALRIFPEGLVLSWDCPNPLKWHKNLSLSLPSSAVKILLRFLALLLHLFGRSHPFPFPLAF